MNVFYFSAEVEPFAKSGGLGDVLGALPKAVAGSGNNVYVVMPLYKDVIKKCYQDQMQHLGYFYTDVCWRHQYVGVKSLAMDNVTYYFVESDYYFSGSMYCFADNERFAYFCKAGLDLITWLGVTAHVLHCNDWSTAYVPLYLHAFYKQNVFLRDSKVVYTVHNLRYQGKMSKSTCQDLTGLGEWYFSQDKLMQDGCVNLMKGAIVFADAVTTVSNTYATEITTQRYGEGLQEIAQQYGYKTAGILNGIDYCTYNPNSDGLIACNYGLTNVVSGKANNKLALQQNVGLPQKKDVPLLALISRLVDQKGLDFLEIALQSVLSADVQLVVLGTGEQRYEQLFYDLAQRYPNKVSANVFFNNDLAHQIYASADFVLVPSAFEPCGLTQLIGLKYGAVPIVRQTGGLKDTVSDYDESTQQGNGFTFVECDANQLATCILRAVNCYKQDKSQYRRIQRNGMKQDFSWKESAQKYINLYKSL